jgi:hypothetical protein
VEPAPLKRRTCTILSTALLLALAGGLIATIAVFWIDAHAGLRVALVASALGVATARAFEPTVGTFAIMTVVYTLLGCGLYALHLLGLSSGALLALGIGLAALIFLILVRALIAAGSADYPYDD